MLLGTVEIDSGLPVMKYEKVGADLVAWSDANQAVSIQNVYELLLW